VTLVRIALDVPGPAGDVRAAGRVRATPTRRRTVGDVVVLPEPFVSALVDGVVTVELAATGADWCWRIDERTPVLGTRYVTVPDVPGTVEYAGLPDVDPSTLDPAVEPEAAWTLALEDTDATVAWLDARVDQLDATQPAVGSEVIVLDETTPVPAGTPAWTLIARSVAAPPPPALEVITSTMTTARGTTGTGVTLGIPAGTVTGDLLVVVVTNSTTGGTFTPPAGWVTLQHLTAFGDYRTTYVFAYSVTGSAPGAPTFTASGSARYVGAMFRVRGADLTTPLAVAGTSGSRTTNTMHVPALAGAAGTLVLSVTNDQATSPNQPIPHVLGAGLTKFLELPSSDDTGVTRTVLVLGWLLPGGDVAAHDVVAAASIAAGASQVLAIRATP